MDLLVKFKGMEFMPIIDFSSNEETVESYADVNKIDDRRVLRIHFKDLTDFETLMEAYRDDDHLSEITIKNESNDEEYIYSDYVIRVSLAFTSVPNTNDLTAENHWIMTLAQLTPADKKLRLIVDVVNKSPATMTLDEYKRTRIDESKLMLQRYLESHPLISNCKNGIFAPYNATTEKQNLFVSQFALYTFNTQAGIPDTMTWNESGKPCTPWTTEECIVFMNAMKAYTKPLVSAQQQYEVDILNAATKTEVEAINIDYDKVHAPNGKQWYTGYTTEEIQRLNDYYGITDEKPYDADEYLSS